MSNFQKYDYKNLLKRAEASLPKDSVVKDRFEMPKVIVFYEGNTTILKNLAEVADHINREVEHIFTYLLKELGTAGDMESERAVFQGRIPDGRVKERVERYIIRYVLCRECGRPDTKLMKRNRTLIMKCEACGAQHPVAGKLK